MRISAPLVSQLHRHTRAHRTRLQLRALLGASQIGALIGSVAMLCVALVAQLIMLPHRYTWWLIHILGQNCVSFDAIVL